MIITISLTVIKKCSYSIVFTILIILDRRVWLLGFWFAVDQVGDKIERLKLSNCIIRDLYRRDGSTEWM